MRTLIAPVATVYDEIAGAPDRTARFNVFSYERERERGGGQNDLKDPKCGQFFHRNTSETSYELCIENRMFAFVFAKSRKSRFVRKKTFAADI